MKFKLQRGGVRRAVRDKDAEQLIKSMRGDEGQIVSRKLFQNTKSPVYLYQQKANEMYQYHIANTLPCGDDSTRLMKNSLYFEYTGRMGQFISELEVFRARIVGTPEIYRDVVQADIDERNMNLRHQNKPETATFDDYLTYGEMGDRLYITWYPEPISTSGDFRFEIPQEMKTRLDNQLAKMVDDAKADIYVRMLAPVRAFINKLSIPIGTEGAVFRNTLVDNITDLVEHLPKLNIDDDPVIAGLLDSLKNTIEPYANNPDVLRDFPNTRNAAKMEMIDILDKITKGYKF